MDIATLLVVASVVVVVLLVAIVSTQLRAARGLADADATRAEWEGVRAQVVEHLEPATYRRADDGVKRLIGFGPHVVRIVDAQKPKRVSEWAAILPDADVHAVSELVQAHFALTLSGMRIEAKLRAVVASRVRTAEERRVMSHAFRRTVVGWAPEAIREQLVDSRVSAKRRAAAENAVAAGIALVDESNELGATTERFVTALRRAEVAYLDARRLLRG